MISPIVYYLYTQGNAVLSMCFYIIGINYILCLVHIQQKNTDPRISLVEKLNT